MAQLIKPGAVKVKVQDGEVFLNIQLELNINLNTTDIVQKTLEEKKDEDVKWEIPKFDSINKVKFGRKD